MSSRDHFFEVVAAVQPVIYGVNELQLDEPTPCEDFTVRDLVNHLLGTSEAMRRVGASEDLDTEDPWGTHGSHITETWREDLGNRLRGLAEAWSQPEAWEGEALDGAMKRATVGDMAYVEVFLHGWDLASATGHDIDYDDASARQAIEVLEEIGEQGRSHHAFAEEVEPGDDASTTDRAVAMAGRRPGWKRD